MAKSLSWFPEINLIVKSMKKGISFTVWCFDPNWAPMLFSDWDFTPTTQGRFFKAYLQGQAK